MCVFFGALSLFPAGLGIFEGCGFVGFCFGLIILGGCCIVFFK